MSTDLASVFLSVTLSAITSSEQTTVTSSSEALLERSEVAKQAFDYLVGTYGQFVRVDFGRDVDIDLLLNRPKSAKSSADVSALFSHIYEVLSGSAGQRD